MHFYYANIWDKGDFYPHNQDSFALQTILTGSGAYALAIVCDGIGSLNKGEYASGLVTASITKWFYEQALPFLCVKKRFSYLKRSFYRALQEVHWKLVREGEEKKLRMGTTISVLILAREHYYIFHVGDCRCYKIGRKIICLTKDQVNEKGALTGAIGVGKMPSVFTDKGRYGKRDSFLVCSDGFGRCLTGYGLEALRISRGGVADKRKLMQELVGRGRLKGEKDNCTGILLKKF